MDGHNISQGNNNRKSSPEINKFNKEAIGWLNRIIDDELKKTYKKVDAALIDECVDYILEIKGVRYDLTTEEVEKRAKELLDIYKERGRGKQRYIIRRLLKPAVITACFITLLICLNMVLLAFNFDALSYVKNWGSDLFELDSGKSESIGNITFVRNGESKEYSSIEQLFAGEGLSLLYPSYVPEDIYFESIVYTDLGNDKEIIYRYSTPVLALYIHDHKTINTSGLTLFKSNGIDYYITVKEDSFCQAVCMYNEHEYIINSADYSILLKIISSMTD
jgi:hypothetical protein